MKINISDLIDTVHKDFKKLEKQSVVVGILGTDKTKKAATPDYTKTQRKLPNTRGSNALMVNSPKRKRAAITFLQLAKILDSTPGFAIFSKPIFTVNGSRDIANIAEAFADGYGEFKDDPKRIKRLENACRSAVRTPILKHQYAAKNDLAYQKIKQGDNYGINTGAFFTKITAAYKKG